MSRTPAALLALTALVIAPRLASAQDTEKSRTVAGGGISVAGWSGVVDPKEAAAGLKLEDAKFASAGKDIAVTTGPATTYWNSKTTLKGNYTVTATFKEAKYMNLNSHPHPYGIVIAGNDMGTANGSYLYCAAYGNGNFIVRGFGPTPFQMNGPRGGMDPAVNKAAGKGEPVEQTIAMSVDGDKVECSINGKVVASYAKADLVTAGKLKSTDGMYGVRFAHNTEGMVTGLTVTTKK